MPKIQHISLAPMLYLRALVFIDQNIEKTGQFIEQALDFARDSEEALMNRFDMLLAREYAKSVNLS